MPVKQVLLLDRDTVVLKSSAPSAHYRQVLRGSGLALGEPVVPRRVRILLMKLPEFLLTAYRKVVKWFLRSVLAFRIVEPSDQIEDPLVIALAALNRGHNFLHVVFLTLLNVICLSKFL